MSRFYVGQRVRAVRRSKGGPHNAKHPTAYIGCECIVEGTLSQQNPGFAPELGNYSVRPIGCPFVGMVWDWQLEPLNPPHVAADWDECEFNRDGSYREPAHA